MVKETDHPGKHTTEISVKLIPKVGPKEAVWLLIMRRFGP